MTIEEIMEKQFVLDQSRRELPELKALIRGIMCVWAERTRKYGIIVNSNHFHRGI